MGVCCELHGPTCEPPSELCCRDCVAELRDAAEPPYACRNCRRPICYEPDVADWLHLELRQYASEPITCTMPRPVVARRA